jgi:putative MATE family efflux protein
LQKVRSLVIVVIVNKRVEVTNTITNGPVWKGLLLFFFPIMLGTFFQQLYNTVDAVVVGQFVGKEALAAVGGGSAIYANLLVGFFTGLSSGATIIIAQFYGARQEKELSRAIHTAMALSVWAGILFSVAGALLARLAMEIIATPADIFEDSVVYLRIYFIGVLPMFIYNMGAGILRALGDSRSPFYILVAGCGANIVLDLVCVAEFHQGVAGAAWATVFSQAVCMVLIFIRLRRLQGCCCFSFRQMRFTPHLLSKMVHMGLPNGIQSSLYTVSNLIIQSNVNAFSTDMVAAWAAYGRIDSIFWMTVSSFGIAVTTYAGQNYGAGNIDRVRRATKEGLLMMSAVSVIYGVLFWFTGRYIFLLFTKDVDVISDGMQMLHFLVPFFITYIPIEVMSGTIHGTGETFKPMIITMLGICVLRVIWLFIAVPLCRNIITVVACYPVTWIATSAAFFIYYRRGTWLRNKHAVTVK